jgi:hypothetical protein
MFLHIYCKKKKASSEEENSIPMAGWIRLSPSGPSAWSYSSSCNNSSISSLGTMLRSNSQNSIPDDYINFISIHTSKIVDMFFVKKL